MPRSGGEYAVEIDRAENRLYLELDGMLDAETAHEAADATVEAASELRPGFGMVNDISSFNPVSQEATEAIERGKRGIAEEGVAAVVRVVGDSVVGKMQFDRVGEGDRSYHVASAESREQAEEFLDRFESDRD
jgi:hypothetical protein